MMLVNAIVNAPHDVAVRIPLRQHFMQLGMLDVIAKLRKENDKDLTVQCDLFVKEMESDRNELSTESIDLRYVIPLPYWL